MPDDRAMTGTIDMLARLASSRRGAALVAAWAFAEAIVFPVVPDVALGLLVLAAPRQVVRLFAAVVVGALAGTAVLYAAAVAAPDLVVRVLTALPGIDASVLAGAARTVASGDPTSIALFGPGTPLKVDTVAWAAGPGTPLALAVGVVLNRVTRIAPLLLVLVLSGSVAPGFVRRHERLVIAAYAAFWIGTYALYFGLVPGFVVLR
jgi:1-acyl-sn-glycerol-3-phosphate acyltransferase